MEAKRYVVMGAGEVGRYLALSLSADGHDVTIIDSDPSKRRIVEDELDVAFVLGNGSHIPTLEAAEVERCDLFVAASSSDEANLAASLLAKSAGAPRSVVRVATSEDVTRYGRVYERNFQADMLLSTQLLTTTRVLNHVLGYNTLEIEYLAGRSPPGAAHGHRGRLRCSRSDRLADAKLPQATASCSRLISGDRVTVPTGNGTGRGWATTPS